MSNSKNSLNRMKPVQKQCSATIYTHVRLDKKEENEGENRLNLKVLKLFTKLLSMSEKLFESYLDK